MYRCCRDKKRLNPVWDWKGIIFIWILSSFRWKWSFKSQVNPHLGLIVTSFEFASLDLLNNQRTMTLICVTLRDKECLCKTRVTQCHAHYWPISHWPSSLPFHQPLCIALELFAFITGQKMANRPQLKEALEDPGNGSTSAQVPKEISRPQYPQVDTTKKAKNTNQSLRPTPPITLAQVTRRAWCLRKASLLRRRRKKPNRRVRQNGTVAGQRHLPAG